MSNATFGTRTPALTVDIVIIRWAQKNVYRLADTVGFGPERARVQRATTFHLGHA